METVRVYVSSTKADFDGERRLVMDWLVAQRMLPVHSYVADTETVRDSCLDDIAGCQVCVLLLGHRYGSRVAAGNPERLSITQLEFRHARALKIPTVALLRTSIPDVALSSIAHPEDGPAVLAFRAEVERAVRPAYFADDKGLIAELSHGVSAILRKSGAAPDGGWAWPRAWDFSAYMADKRGRFCGRTWLHADVRDWLAQPAPRALLLCAGYGVGKSAFVSDLVHRDGLLPPEERRVAAVHFCQHDTRETLRAGVFVRNVAARLAERFAPYRDSVSARPDLQALLDNATADPGSAFEAAVLNPLHHLPEPALPQLLLVDAIDESLEAGGTDGARRALLRLLAAKAARFPPWLRLMATSRDNAAVRERLSAAFGLREIDAEARPNLDDLEAYARQRAADAPIAGRLAAAGVTAEAAAGLLRDKSAGKFLYAVRALDDLASGRLPAARLAALPPGIDGFYLDAFERRFGEPGEDGAAGDGSDPDAPRRTGDGYAAAALVLGLMAAAREPLGPDALAAAAGLPVKSVKSLRSERLGDFIRLRDGRWVFDHLSLPEWLAGVNDEGDPRAGAFAVDLQSALARLAAWGERCFAEQGAAAPDHVLRHLGAYLHDSGAPERLRRLLLDPAWLHAKLRRFGPAAWWPDFALAPRDAGLDTLRRTLDRSAHVLRRDPDQLCAQLLGRLREDAAGTPDAPDALAPLRAACRAWRGARWLRPLTPSLAPPGALLRVLQGHTGPVTVVAFEPNDGHLLLSASDDRNARLWNEGGEAVAVLGPHGGFVREGAFSPDGRHVLTGSDDGTARLWRVDGERVATLRGHRGRIRFAAFSPDGRRVVTVGDDTVLRLWAAPLEASSDARGQAPGQAPSPPADESAGALLAELSGHTHQVRHVGFSPDSRSLVSASYDRTARVWNLDGLCLATLGGHGRGLTHACFAPDGQTVLTASHDNSARLWRADGTPLHAFNGHTSTVNQAVFSPDGRFVLTASADTTARLWRVDGTLLHELRGHARRVHRAIFSPDGTQVLTASVDAVARLWSVDGTLRAELEGNTIPGEQAAFSPDGTRIATACADRAVRVWSLGAAGGPAGVPGRPAGASAAAPLCEVRQERIAQVLISPDRAVVLARGSRRGVELRHPDGRRIAELRGHADVLRRAGFSPDGTRVLTLGYEGVARLWRADGEPVAVLVVDGAELLHVAFRPDAQGVAAACSDGSVRFWDAGGAPVATLRGHADRVHQIAFSPAGDRFASAGNDAVVRLWSAAGEPLAVLTGHGSRVMRVLFSHDGEQLVSCAKNGSVGLWTRDGEPRAMLQAHSTVARHTYYSRDGRRLLTASADGSSRIWDRDGGLVAQLDGTPVSGKRSPFAPDGDVLLASSTGNDLLVWPDRAGAPLRLSGHTGAVSAAMFSDDGGRVLSAAEDGSVRVWSRDGEALAVLDVDAPVTALDGAGPLLVCGDAAGQLHFLAVEEPA